MSHFDIVAHRGIPDGSPENSLPAFQRAVELGADAVEMDVRLTADRIPVIYHFYYLEELSPLVGPIFKFTAEELKQVYVRSRSDSAIHAPIPTLREVMETIAGRIGLEIEIKGPEPECVDIIAEVLQDYRQSWDRIEVTSFEPALLQGIREQCPGMVTDLLFPRSEPWMALDVAAWQALHHARLAGARAVHLQPSQLSTESVSLIRKNGIEIHAWDVNDGASLETCAQFKIPRICTDQFQLALDFRNTLT